MLLKFTEMKKIENFKNLEILQTRLVTVLGGNAETCSETRCGTNSGACGDVEVIESDDHSTRTYIIDLCDF